MPGFSALGISLGWLGLVAASASAAEAPLPAVGVTPVLVRDVSPGTEFVGRVEAQNSVDVRARVEGFVQERPFQEGQLIQQGQVLFIIETTAYEAALAVTKATLASAQATLQEAEQRFQRNQELRRTNAIAQATLDEAVAARDVAQANVKSAEASVRQAQLNLDYTTIRAPISGRVGRAAFSVGSLVGPTSEPLARVVQVDPIRVVFSVSDRTILELRTQAGDLSEDELSKRFVPTVRFPTGVAYEPTGEIEFFGNEFDPQTGTIPIWARFANSRAMLVPGQFVTVSVQRAEPMRRPVVPIGAVEQDRDGRFVLVLEHGDRVGIRRIRVGAQIGQYWTVEEGLGGGESLIVQGLQNVRPGTVVRPIVSENAADNDAPVAGAGGP
ncbi:efflux RND transporter periplasmic adaptor subunit [Flaviflagellibacter deserti]|uniref:Efflux RND transporter periplasmic adaptor subunit n=1 Tax=Flaviflagellibacter deserti TaxID=2267266 RepID=A0ABV9YXJ3_9HYPH